MICVAQVPLPMKMMFSLSALQFELALLRNTTALSLQDLEYVFINSKVGFGRTFLDYHDALQFRGGDSNNATEFAQSQVRWENADQRQRSVCWILYTYTP